MKIILYFCVLVAAVTALPQNHHQTNFEKLRDDIKTAHNNGIIDKEILAQIIKKAILEKIHSINPHFYEEKILNFLEEIRQGMGEPNEKLGLPPLDPLSIQHADLNIDIELVQLVGTLDNVTVTDLSKFIVDYVHLSIAPIAFFINMTLPSLNAKGNYKANGNLGGALPVYGEGPFEINITEFSFNASAYIGSIPGNYLNITRMELEYKLGNLHVNIGGLEGGGDFGQMVNDIINDIGTQKINEMEEQISATAVNVISTMINKKLNTLTLQDILGMLG